MQEENSSLVQSLSILTCGPDWMYDLWNNDLKIQNCGRLSRYVDLRLAYGFTDSLPND